MLLAIVLLHASPLRGQERAPRVADLQLTPPAATLRVGSAQQFVPIAYDAVGNPLTQVRATFASNNPNVVRIDAQGRAVAVAPGTALITARAGSGSTRRSAQASVRVVGGEGAGVRVRTVEVFPPDAQIQVGQQQVFLANAYDAGNNPVATASFTFTSSNPRIATVDINGIAVGVAPGTVIMTARTGSGAAAKSGMATLTVTGAGAPAPLAVAPSAAVPGAAALAPGVGPAVGLRIRPLRVVLVRGEALMLQYEALNANGELADRVPVVFRVAPGGERVISVDSVGFIRAVGDTGVARVQALVPGNPNIQERSVAVEVRDDKVRFSRAELWLPVGAVDTLGLEVPAQGRAFNVRGEFQFFSSDEAKVRVSPLLPIITAVATGTARVVGESPYGTVTMQVHVLRPVAMIAAVPSDPSVVLVIGSSVRFAVRALAADSSLVPEAPLAWTSPDTAIARFDPATRTLRAVGTGETRLRVAARWGRDSVIARSWRIRVMGGELAVSRSRVGLGAGEMTAVSVQLLDEGRQPMGPATELRWTSSADSIARYADGQVQGLKPGHARLVARTAWDSSVAVDVFVVGQLLAPLQRGGRWDLYTFGPDSVPRFAPVTADAAVELEPAWSPDLTRIAYVAAPVDRPTSLDLFVANADGSESRRLTNDSATVGSPVFVRPTGDQLVFQSNQGGMVQLHVMNRDGTGRRTLTSGPNPNGQPDVSPDGRKILFTSLRQLPGSPRNYDVWEMNIDGTGERRLTSSPRVEDSPLYAADGQSFYYLRDEGGSLATKRVYRQSLTDSTGATAQPITPDGMFVRAFSVSADGNLLVLTKIESVPGVGQVLRVVLFNPATATSVLIRIGAGEQLAAPVFRPATPQPR